MKIDSSNHLINYKKIYDENNISSEKSKKEDLLHSEGKRSDKESGVLYSHAPATKYSDRDGIVVMKAAASDVYENQQVQSKLSSLGFYSGPIDGNLNSSVSRSAITVFQKVYGVSGENGNYGSRTRTKLTSVYNTYLSAYNSQGCTNLKQQYGLDYTEKANMARTWAFLRKGMGLTAKQSAGIMGNMLLESRFSSDNANEGMYPGDHDYNYSYSTNDGVAYGLIQWRDSSRKQGLLNKAGELGLSVSNLNAQLAYLRQELTGSVNGNSSYKYWWENYVVTQTSVQNMCDRFAEYIEGNTGSRETRRANAQAIYNAFYAF